MREWSESNQTISWTVNWLEWVWLTESVLLEVRIFPFAHIKILVDTYQLEWWLIICLWGIASCQHFAGWIKGRESLDWAVLTCFWFLGEKKQQQIFSCSSYAVSGCAKAKQVSSSHILFPTASHLTFLHPVPRCCCITTNFSNLCSCQAHILASKFTLLPLHPPYWIRLEWGQVCQV